MAIKYKWLAGTLRDLIKKDVKNQINKLPSEQELCRRYHVSRQTVRQALNLLTQEGLIEKRHGSGSYITGHSANLSDDQIAILISDDSNYIYPGVLDDIQGTLRKYHFSSQVHITKNETYEERKILTKLLSAPPRGIIVEGSRSYLPNPNLDLYRALQKKNCRFVFLHNYYQNFSQIPFVKAASLQSIFFPRDIQHLAASFTLTTCRVQNAFKDLWRLCVTRGFLSRIPESAGSTLMIWTTCSVFRTLGS